MDFLASVWEYLHEVNVVSTLVRVLLAALAGGLVGIEREFHGRAAGLRTHMLVALGAALTALIGVYLSMTLQTDVQRTGAQVMSGVGFLGAGTILLKKGNSRITGLTTAAGLWATAAIGLAVGYGFYAGAFATVVTVILAFTLVSRVEHRMSRNRLRLFVYLEIDSVASVQEMIKILQEKFGAVEVQVTPARSSTQPHVGMEALIRIPPKVTVEEKMEKLHSLDHVIFALQIG